MQANGETEKERWQRDMKEMLILIFYFIYSEKPRNQIINLKEGRNDSCFVSYPIIHFS